jgi:Zn-dependent M28 family amino/carboxypeptidase
VREWIFDKFKEFGYETAYQGLYHNVMAETTSKEKAYILVGAHYDSVPHCPGADDNASAIACLLSCARMISESYSSIPVMFAAFNREEDDLIGSSEFVKNYILKQKISIQESHILEMLGYSSDIQNFPTELPIQAPPKGDFLGLISNMRSNKILVHVLKHAKSYMPEFNVLGLKVYCGLERYFPVLKRSDHAPFWDAKIPSVMWTDTSEFRNPHYHQTADTPETLNYLFMSNVTKLLALRIILFAKNLGSLTPKK